jgi:hypothetical protein
MNDRTLTIAAWIALGVVFLALQILAAATRRLFPGVGTALDRIVALPAGRVVVALGWMWLGWHVFAR